MERLWKNFLYGGLFFILILTNFSFEVLAKETLLNNKELEQIGFVGYEKVNPNQLTFPFKQITEEFISYLKTNEHDKQEYQYDLLDNRFRELVYIINFQKTSFLPEVVARYNEQVGVIKSSYISDEKDTKDNLKKYFEILGFLRDRYPANSTYWMNIQQAVDTTESLY